jgi:hypothetical protein
MPLLPAAEASQAPRADLAALGALAEDPPTRPQGALDAGSLGVPLGVPLGESGPLESPTSLDLRPPVSFSLELGAPPPQPARQPVPLSILADVARPPPEQEPTSPLAQTLQGLEPVGPRNAETVRGLTAVGARPPDDATQPTAKPLTRGDETTQGRAVAAPPWLPWALVGVAVVLVVVVTGLLLAPEPPPPPPAAISPARPLEQALSAAPAAPVGEVAVAPAVPELKVPDLPAAPYTPRVVPSVEERRAGFYNADPVAVAPKRGKKPSKAPVKKGWLRISTTWEGDLVPSFCWLDGKERGPTPVEVFVKPGEHLIRIDYLNRPPFEVKYPIIASKRSKKGDDLIIELSPKAHTAAVGVVKGERR